MKRITVIIIFVISFLYALPAYNKFWFPFDEGITLTCADMIRNGAVPYRDFVTIYGPIQLYALALLFKIFGAYIQLAHIYIIFLHAVVATVIFYVAYRLSLSKPISVFIWLAGVSCLAPRMGAVASTMWPFMAAGAVSMLFFIWFIEKKSYRDLMMAALFASVGLLGRFEMGVYLICCELAVMAIYAFFRYFAPYILAVSVLPAAYLIYLAREKALAALWDCLRLPYTTILQFGKTDFPMPCIDLRQIFYGSLFFISVNQHYIPIIAYAVTAAAIIYLNIKKKIEPAKSAMLLLITLVGVATFPYAYFGASPTHTMPVIFPALMLSAFIMGEAAGAAGAGRGYRRFMKISAALLAFLLVLLFIKNTDKFIKNVFVKPFTKQIVPLDTKRGSVYVPRQDIDSVKEAVEYIEGNTAAGEKIYMGFESNDEVYQGGETMIYFLSGRLPATRRFVTFPGTINREDVQREIIDSLKETRVILLTGEGKIRPKSSYGEKGSGLLDEYIRNNYVLAGKAGKYGIYLRKD